MRETTLPGSRDLARKKDYKKTGQHYDPHTSLCIVLIALTACESADGVDADLANSDPTITADENTQKGL